MSYFGTYFGEEEGGGGGEDDSTPTIAPIPAVVSSSSSQFRDHFRDALKRLPFQFRDPDV